MENKFKLKDLGRLTKMKGYTSLKENMSWESLKIVAYWGPNLPRFQWKDILTSKMRKLNHYQILHFIENWLVN